MRITVSGLRPKGIFSRINIESSALIAFSVPIFSIFASPEICREFFKTQTMIKKHEAQYNGISSLLRMSLVSVKAIFFNSKGKFFYKNHHWSNHIRNSWNWFVVCTAKEQGKKDHKWASSNWFSFKRQWPNTSYLSAKWPLEWIQIWERNRNIPGNTGTTETMSDMYPHPSQIRMYIAVAEL